MPNPSATALQGWIVIATTWLAVAAAAVVAPAAPQIAAHFSDTPGAEGLVQISIGLPALFAALLATPSGFLADRIGRKPVLLVALAVYTICGVAPLVLNSLPQILVSRAGVGIAEAAVLATSTALLGDMFKGRDREKWFAIQGGSATIVAVALIALSGALGESNWRAPFAVYFGPLILLVLAARFCREPQRGPAHAQENVAPLAGMRLARIGVVTFFAAIAFYVVLIQLPFLLADRGFDAPRFAAMGVGAGAISAPLGAYAFRLLSRFPVATKMTVSFAFSALGLALIYVGEDLRLMLLGAAVNGFGSGMALPTLMTWAMTGLEFEQRGRVAGFWNGCFFFGQFLSPLVFIGISAAVGNRSAAFAVFACATALAAVGALAIAFAGASRFARIAAPAEK